MNTYSMDNGIHFISGLPRAGTTLLAALLRQNPRFHAGITSPAGSLFVSLMRQMSQENETAVHIDDARREAVLRGVFANYYHREHPRQVVFDTNRLWCAKASSLAALFPKARIIACVRHVPWIVDSLERLVQTNALQPSRIFNFDPAQTVYFRYEVLAANAGLLGFAWNAMREAFYGLHADRLMLLTYETLATDPARALQAVYDFVEEPMVAHDFSNAVLDASDYDTRLGAPGLHRIRPVVRAEERATILPPDLFQRVEKDSFWREPAAQKRGVRIV